MLKMYRNTTSKFQVVGNTEDLIFAGTEAQCTSFLNDMPN